MAELEEMMISITYEEYDRLKKIAAGLIKPCEGRDCPFQQIYSKKRFSLSQCLAGFSKVLTAKETWVFGVSTYMFYKFAPKNDFSYCVAYSIICITFMFFTALSNLIYNGKLDVSLKAEAAAQIAKGLKT